MIKPSEKQTTTNNSHSYTTKANAICETVFNLADNDDLAKLVRNSYGTYWDEAWEGRYAYIAYFDEPVPKVFYATTDSDLESLKQRIGKSFKSHLLAMVNPDIKLLNILLCHFPYLQKPLQQYNGNPNPFLDAILAESAGWIAYKYQLENLFMLATKLGNTEAEQFRKNLNAKRIEKITPFLNTPLFNTTLGQILEDRMISEFVALPCYSSAAELFYYLTETDK